jgi:hypothetical protein
VLAAPVPVPFAEETVEPFVRVRRRDVDR